MCQTYQRSCPETTVPMMLPAPDDVENAENDHQNTEYDEQPPGTRFLVVDLHFLHDDHFRSHGGDPGGRLEGCGCVKSARDEGCGAQLVGALCRYCAACVRPVAVRVNWRCGGRLSWFTRTTPEQQVATRRRRLRSVCWTTREQWSSIIIEPHSVLTVLSTRASLVTAVSTATHSYTDTIMRYSRTALSKNVSVRPSVCLSVCVFMCLRTE